MENLNEGINIKEHFKDFYDQKFSLVKKMLKRKIRTASDLMAWDMEKENKKSRDLYGNLSRVGGKPS